MRTPRRWWCRCRRPPSIAAWLISEPSIDSRDVSVPSRDRCSKVRSRCGPGPTGTTRGPGFVEIDLVGHDGGNPAGPHAFTLTVTDIATGWTENRSVPDKTGKCVLAALNDIAAKMPFPILGVDSDNGSEFINDHLWRWCQRRKITFTRARPGNKNDGCHVEQKNWAVVRTVVGYHRYDTATELLLLNEIWQLQSKLTNYFYPQQKLVSKIRHGAKVSKKHDKASTEASPVLCTPCYV